MGSTRHREANAQELRGGSSRPRAKQSVGLEAGPALADLFPYSRLAAKYGRINIMVNPNLGV